ncbi:MAG: NAD-dependent deacetylase [bacterium]|nr:NAD-dependent deacetylase [bacterium]
MLIEDNLNKAAQAVAESEAIMISAGAGMGVDSGLPDFRGNEGFWKAYPPIGELGISFVDMANPRWFETNPRLAWGFYGHRLNLYRSTEPHKGFAQLLELAGEKPGGCFVFTSNVDGQFQKAGFSEDFIEECHGSIHHFQCTGVCSDSIWDAADINVSVDESKLEAENPLPACINCSRLARPNILMFGDWKWIGTRSDRQGMNMNRWLQDIMDKGLKLVVIELGAGQAVPTVRMRSEYTAQMSGGTLIRINPRDHNVPQNQISIPLGGGEGIDRIYRRIKETK